MDKYTKTVLIVVAVCLVIQTDRRTVASETNSSAREVLEAQFFDPSESTSYAGRLFSLRKSYPLMEMRKLCESHTGLDTAQVNCQKIKGHTGYICDYKCSKHWLAQ